MTNLVGMALVILSVSTTTNVQTKVSRQARITNNIYAVSITEVPTEVVTTYSIGTRVDGVDTVLFEYNRTMPWKPVPPAEPKKEEEAEEEKDGVDEQGP